MKKTIFLLIALFTLNVAFAQEVSFGVKAGLNYGGTLTSDSDYNDLFKASAKVQFGAFAEFGFNDAFALQAGLDYFGSGFQGKGEYVEYNSLETKYDFKGKLAYLQIPVVAKYYVVEGLSLEAGPYVGFLLGAKYDGNAYVNHPLAGDDYLVASFEDEDVKDEYNSTDFGLKLGVGYQLENGLLFNVGYNLGLSDIQKPLEAETSGEDGVRGTDSFKVKNQFLQFSIGYKFM